MKKNLDLEFYSLFKKKYTQEISPLVKKNQFKVYHFIDLREYFLALFTFKQVILIRIYLLTNFFYTTIIYIFIFWFMFTIVVIFYILPYYSKFLFWLLLILFICLLISNRIQENVRLKKNVNLKEILLLIAKDYLILIKKLYFEYIDWFRELYYVLFWWYNFQTIVFLKKWLILWWKFYDYKKDTKKLNSEFKQIDRSFWELLLYDNKSKNISLWYIWIAVILFLFSLFMLIYPIVTNSTPPLYNIFFIFCIGWAIYFIDILLFILFKIYQKFFPSTEDKLKNILIEYDKRQNKIKEYYIYLTDKIDNFLNGTIFALSKDIAKYFPKIDKLLNKNEKTIEKIINLLEEKTVLKENIDIEKFKSNKYFYYLEFLENILKIVLMYIDKIQKELSNIENILQTTTSQDKWKLELRQVELKLLLKNLEWQKKYLEWLKYKILVLTKNNKIK